MRELTLARPTMRNRLEFPQWCNQGHAWFCRGGVLLTNAHLFDHLSPMEARRVRVRVVDHTTDLPQWHDARVLHIMTGPIISTPSEPSNHSLHTAYLDPGSCSDLCVSECASSGRLSNQPRLCLGIAWANYSVVTGPKAFPVLMQVHWI